MIVLYHWRVLVSTFPDEPKELFFSVGPFETKQEARTFADELLGNMNIVSILPWMDGRDENGPYGRHRPYLRDLELCM